MHFASDIHFALEYKYHLLSWLSSLTATNSNNFELGKRLLSISQYELSMKYLQYLLCLIFHLFILKDEELSFVFVKTKEVSLHKFLGHSILSLPLLAIVSHNPVHEFINLYFKTISTVFPLQLHWKNYSKISLFG